MKYREYPAHSSLSDAVNCFWTLERTYAAGEVEEVIPDACVELILNFGKPYHLLAEGRPDRQMPKAFLVGLQRAPLRYRCAGTVNLVAARFYSWGALPLLTSLRRGPEDPHVALGSDWDELLVEIESSVVAGEPSAAVAHLEEYLVERLLAATFDAKRVRAAAQMLHRETGSVKIADLAERCFLSVRQLERQVRSAIGMSPKALARTMRFDAARERLMFEPEANLTDLAHECGYSDQAHFIRDFRAFAGKTPGEFVDEIRALHSMLRQDPDVVFLRPRPTAP